MNRIQALRLEKGIKQADLAREINVSPSALSGYETGKYQAADSVYAYLAKKFGVTLDYLMGISDARGPNPADGLSESKAAMLKMIDGMTDEQAEKLLGIAQLVFKPDKDKK